MTKTAPPIRTERQLNPFALQALRKAKGYKQQDEFATAVDCSPSYYCRLENGTRQPSPETLARICNVLEIDVRAVTSLVALYSVDAA